MSSSCHILSIPTELRLLIYSHILSPTQTLTLTSTPTHRHAVQPQITPALLATCHQIHHEAQPLLYAEDTITLTIDAHETYWPPISESRLPQRVLEKIEHLCVVFDCTGSLYGSYEEVDFAAFEALVKLKTLRIGMIYAGDVDQSAHELFTEVLMRVPRDARVLCGIEEGSQEGRLLEDVLRARREVRQNPEEIKVMGKDFIERSVAKVPGEVRGMKNGSNPDVFARYRVYPDELGRRFAVI